jgi:Colicin E5 ribonuclease domain
MGRFLSPDWSSDPEPIPFADITNPQSLNLYSYGSNNPLSTVDPDGHDVSICPAGATQITSACQTISDDQYKASLNGNGSLSLPSFSSLQQNGSGDITGSDVGSAGTAIYTPNNPGVDGAANAAAFGQIGDQGMGAINFFMTNMALSAVGETALNGVRLGAEAVMAARAAKAADAAAQATSQSWKFGAFKSAAKWANQLLQRGWTESEITDTIANGERYPAPNNINPANGATRFVSPTTGKSVVVDNVTNEVLHVGGSGFQY